MNAILRITATVCATIACVMVAGSMAFGQPGGDDSQAIFDCNLHCKCLLPDKNKCEHPLYPDQNPKCKTSVCECIRRVTKSSCETK